MLQKRRSGIWDLASKDVARLAQSMKTVLMRSFVYWSVERSRFGLSVMRQRVCDHCFEREQKRPRAKSGRWFVHYQKWSDWLDLKSAQKKFLLITSWEWKDSQTLKWGKPFLLPINWINSVRTLLSFQQNRADIQIGRWIAAFSYYYCER